MLNADMNVRYWRKMIRRYSLYQFWTKFLLAATSATSVASWQFWQDAPQVWKGITSAVVLGGIAMSVLNPQDKIRDMTEIWSHWKSLLSEFELQWARIDCVNGDKAAKDFKKCATKISDWGAKELSLPSSNRLLEKSQSEVIEARGLTRQPTGE
jgi:hypothetical protein